MVNVMLFVFYNIIVLPNNIKISWSKRRICIKCIKKIISIFFFLFFFFNVDKSSVLKKGAYKRV